jgi:hypothetical protein
MIKIFMLILAIIMMIICTGSCNLFNKKGTYRTTCIEGHIYYINNYDNYAVTFAPKVTDAGKPYRCEIQLNYNDNISD